MNLKSLSVTGDNSVITLELGEGLSQHLLPADARILAERLLEFSSKEGGTDVELTRHLHLGVKSTSSIVSFTIFSPDQGPQRWNDLDKQAAVAAAERITSLLTSVP